MTPPNVLGAPNPWSSVMISKTFGAPLGGTTRGAHRGWESEAFSLITPRISDQIAEAAFPRSWSWLRVKPGTPVTC